MASSSIDNLPPAFSTPARPGDFNVGYRAKDADKFRPAYNAPMLPGTVYLDYDSKDADGNYYAKEGTLKSLVVIKTAAKKQDLPTGFIEPSGRLRRIHGVSGMTGAGKTISLIGLGHDNDVKDRFVHGVLYMAIGPNATVEHIANQLNKIMRVTGSTVSAMEVAASRSLSDAVAKAAVWFQGKRILFLVDDLWPSDTGPEGILPELEGLLRASPESCIVLSTRSLVIAAYGGSRVDIGPRDPCGAISLAMFMANAAPEIEQSEGVLKTTKGILEICSGLPVALSIAGAWVSVYMKTGLSFEQSCRMYLEEITEDIASYPGASFLDSAIRLSLGTLAQKFEVDGKYEPTEFSVSDLYTSLCVMQNRQLAPISVLARMWGVSEGKAEDICIIFCSMSLARLSTEIVGDGREECGLYVHELHLDYCRHRATDSGKEKEWHRSLLDSHLLAGDSSDEAGASGDVDGPLGLRMLDYTPRPWWKDGIWNAEYMRKNVSRHLRGAGLELELGATVLDLRWMHAQALAGGSLALKNDLGILEAAVKGHFASTSSLDPVVNREASPVKLISDIVVANAGSLTMGRRVLSHLFYSSLFLLSKTNEWIQLFLERMKDVTQSPFLEPVLTSYRPPGDDLKFEIEYKVSDETESCFLSTDYTDRYLAGATNSGVVVFNLETQERMKCLNVHEKNVSVVKFSTDASKVISGSFDNNVIVWDWQTTESPAVTLIGHEGTVTALALTRDDSRLFSGSRDGTVKVWDMESGQLCHEFVFDAEVECAAASPTSDIFAVGTRDGRLRCVNWGSEQIVFEHSMPDIDAISAVQFGGDGKMLACGTAMGNATSWHTADWKKAAAVYVPGSVTNVSFHPDGTNVVLGSSQGEIRNWKVTENKLALYNIAMARPVNGLSFRNNGADIIVGVQLGYVRAWSGPQSNPSLDFEDFRKSMLYDFALSADGSRVATTTHDSMIRVWSTATGSEIVAYPPPEDGSRRLALRADGHTIASISTNGMTTVWNSEGAPVEGDISFKVDADSVSCLSLIPDGSMLLVCLQDEVQIWSLSTRTKVGSVACYGSLDATFNSDGQFIIVGNSTRTTIWDATSRENVFDTAAETAQSMSFSEAKNVIQACGPSAHRMRAYSLAASGGISGRLEEASSATELTMDNVFNFVPRHYRPVDMEFSKDVLVLNDYGVLAIFRLRQ